ncbi:hypothetical protein AB0N06_32890 [Streptomyces sp. NPDC051020]|uniref:hypothetical protein n=1 Tax=Streptomyces sp. NPDC051020 TaxID=3155409 RepID=UPI00342A7C30
MDPHLRGQEVAHHGAPTSAVRAGLANGWASPSDVAPGQRQPVGQALRRLTALGLGGAADDLAPTAGIRPARSAGMSAVTPTMSRAPIGTTLTHHGVVDHVPRHHAVHQLDRAMRGGRGPGQAHATDRLARHDRSRMRLL